MRAGNLILLAAILGAVVASFLYLGIDLGALVVGDSLAQMGQYASGFLQPDFSAVLPCTSRACCSTPCAPSPSWSGRR